MHKELEVMKPRCNGLWKRCTGTVALIYFWMLANVPMVAFAKDEKGNATDTGVKGRHQCNQGLGSWMCWWSRCDFSCLGFVRLWYRVLGT